MTITTEPFGIRSIEVKNNSGKVLTVHYHRGGYGPRITFRADRDILSSGFELTMKDAEEFAEALRVMAQDKL